jgi:hypothetical protein
MRYLFFVVLLVCVLIAFSFTSCGVIQQTSCEDIATVMHDASLFVCQVIRGDTSSTANVKREEVLDRMISNYIELVGAIPKDSPEKNKILVRLYAARQQLREVALQ